MTRMRRRVGLLVLLIAVTASASAIRAEAYTQGRTQGIALFSLENAALGMTVRGDQVVLDTVGADNAGRWNVTDLDPQSPFLKIVQYTNVATGTCLAAQSPIDGLVLKLVTCDRNDPKQQWSNHWQDRFYNEGIDRCIKPDGLGAGSRLYTEVCNTSDDDTEFSDLFRVKLAVVSGDGQQIRPGATGQPLVARITDENGSPLSGFTVVFELQGPPDTEPGGFLPSPAAFGSQGSRVAIVSDAQGLVTTPALTGLRNQSGTFTALLTPSLTVIGDVYALQKPTFHGSVG